MQRPRLQNGLTKFITSIVIASLAFQLTCAFAPISSTASTRNHRGTAPSNPSPPPSLVVLHERKFAQKQNANKPKFQQKQNRNRSRNDDERTTQPKYRGDGKLVELHDQRVKTAGRVGTKRFVDPCKVFVGNLPYTTTAQQLKDFVLTTMGQTNLVVHSTKIIKEWKTGKSKGYGFIMFTDPIYATVCMEVVHNKVLDGRHVTVSQGKKKDQDNILFIKKKKKQEEENLLSDEDQAIVSGLEEAESDEEEIDVDLDLDEDGIPIFRDIDASDAEDLELDAKLFGIVGGDGDDDDDDDYSDIDGVFLERGPIYEDMDPNLNREQRREAARRMKRKKMPHKGFG